MGSTGRRPSLSVVLPSIAGREHWLEKALFSLEKTVADFEVDVILDEPTCGRAWNIGIERARGDYILLFADDLEAHQGWFEAGRHLLSRNVIPCPRILNPDGTLQSCGTFSEEAADGDESVLARVPLLTQWMARAMWPIFENHYMGDHWISWRGKQLGWPTRVVRKMVFTHHFAMEGRIDSLDADVKAYEEATG